MNSSEQPSGGRPSDAARVRSWGFGPSVVVILLGAVILLAGPFVVRQLEFAVQEVSVEAASSRLDDQNLLALMNQATQDLAAKVGPSVVHVSTRNSLREGGFRPTSFYTSSGSGWIYDDDGHIVTNAHVITSAEVIEVQLSSGEIRTARFIGADARSDIAVVKISPERLTPADRNSGLPRQGDNGRKEVLLDLEHGAVDLGADTNGLIPLLLGFNARISAPGRRQAAEVERHAVAMAFGSSLRSTTGERRKWHDT